MLFDLKYDLKWYLIFLGPEIQSMNLLFLVDYLLNLQIL